MVGLLGCWKKCGLEKIKILIVYFFQKQTFYFVLGSGGRGSKVVGRAKKIKILKF